MTARDARGRALSIPPMGELLAIAPVGVAIVDRELRLVSVNETMAALSGRPADEHAGRTLAETLGESGARALEASLRQVLATGEPISGVPLPDVVAGPAGPRELIASYHPVGGEPGEPPAGACAIVVEVADRARAEQEVARSEVRFRAMADATPALIWTTDAEGGCDFVNLGLAEFTGMAREDHLGDGWLAAVHVDDRPAARAVVRSAIHDAREAEVEFRLRHAGGGFRPVLARGAPRPGEGGEVAGFVGSCMDIAERRRAEAELRVLASVSELLDSPLDADERLRRVAQMVVPGLADGCRVDLVENGAIRTVAIAAAGAEPSGGAIREAIRSGEAALHSVGAGARPRPLGGASAMAVPLAVRGTTIGAMGLVALGSGRRYDRRDLNVAQEVARRAALAVDAARLYQGELQARRRAERAERHAELLAQVGAALEGPLAVRERLERLGELLVPEIGDLCTIRMRRPDDSLALVAASARDPRTAEALHLPWPDPLPADAPVIGRVVATGRPELAAEATAAEAPDDPGPEARERLGVRSYMCVPFGARGTVHGAVTLQAAAPRCPYGPEDLGAAQEIAARAGLAVDNALLYEAQAEARDSAERAAEDLARLQRVTAALSRAVGTEDIAQVVVEEGVDALRAVAGLLALRRGEEVEVIRAVGYPPETVAEGRRFSLHDRVPMAHVTRVGEPVWLESRADWLRLFREPAPGLGATGVGLPLLVEGRAIGAVGFRFAEDERPFSPVERELMVALAAQCAQALERARLFEAERGARVVATTLQEFTRSLAAALEPADVARAALAHGLPGVGATSGMVMLVSPNGEHLELVAQEGLADADARRWERVALDAAGPLAAAVRESRTIVMASGDQVAGLLGDTDEGGGGGALVPLEAHGRAVGVLALRFATAPALQAAAADLLAAVGHLAAQALERVELYERTEAERRRATFLAELTGTLEAATDPEERLRLFAERAVPEMGDLCSVHLVTDDGSLALAASAHVDPELADVLRRLAPGVLHEVARQNRPVVSSHVTAAEIEAWADDAGDLAERRRIPLGSYAAVPMAARGRVLGTVAVGAAEEGRYGEGGLSLVQELARRLALQLDNALLLRREQDARAQAERARGRLAGLQRVTAALSEGVGEGHIARAATAQVRAALGAEIALLVLQRATGPELAAQDGIPDAQVPPIRRAVETDRLGVTEALRTRAAIFLAEEREWRERYPTGRAVFEGIARSAWCLPLLARGTRVGALGLYFARERNPTPGDRALALTLADQCALALERARLYEAEREIAETLQGSLLPAATPDLPGLEIGVRYRPATALEAGGDWYEVLTLPDGVAGLSVGDVVGRGVGAAAVMGQLRSGLRAYALEGAAPAPALVMLSRFAATVPGARAATAAIARADAATGRIRFASAGHPPPLVLRSGAPPEYVWKGRGPPLGAVANPAYSEADVDLDAGDALVLYSDGLMERRGEGIDAGLDRLRRAAERARGRDAEGICSSILSDLLPDANPQDDVVLLVARRMPPE